MSAPCNRCDGNCPDCPLKAKRPAEGTPVDDPADIPVQVCEDVMVKLPPPPTPSMVLLKNLDEMLVEGSVVVISLDVLDETEAEEPVKPLPRPALPPLGAALLAEFAAAMDAGTLVVVVPGQEEDAE